jgi:DnaK suppressor protein
MIDEKLCNELHEQLLADRGRLQHEIELLGSGGIRGDTFQADEQDNVDQHPADQGSELFEREKNLTVQRTLEINLQEVNDALRKFDDGTYGLCANCEKPIAEKRLRALPAATHCIECQAKLERMAQLSARQ